MSKPPTPFGRAAFEFEPSELSLSRARAFSEPAFLGLVLIAAFLTFLFGSAYYLQGETTIGIIIYVIGGGLTALLVVAWWLLSRE